MEYDEFELLYESEILEWLRVNKFKEFNEAMEAVRIANQPKINVYD